MFYAKMITLRFLATLARDKYKRVWIRATVASSLVWALDCFLGSGVSVQSASHLGNHLGGLLQSSKA